MNSLCISCNKCVRPCQEGLQCEHCLKWQHRRCDTGISREVYRAAVKNITEIDWKCRVCVHPRLPSPPRSTVTTGLSPPCNTAGFRLSPPPGLQLLPLINISSISRTKLGSFTVQLDDSGLSNAPRTESTRLSFEDVVALDYMPNVPVLPTRPNLSSYALQEESLVDTRPLEISENESYSADFVVVDQGTERGKPLLIETTGFSYTRKKVNGNRINWTCNVIGIHNWCKATVNQNGNIFSQGKVEHNHPAAPGMLRQTEQNKQIKTIASQQIFRSAKDIVEYVQLENDQNGHLRETCTVDSLARKANRHRKTFRPDNPHDLKFKVDIEYLCSLDPDAKTFFQGSFRVNEQRHLIFATPAQLHQLGQAKTWYVDGTFKIMAAPFVQLFGIHVFVRCGEDATRVPLVFVLMSRRQTVDYMAVFSTILEKITPENNVKRIVTDFEAATWAAIRAILPEVEIKGCLFHWTQAVFKRIRQEGLERSYHERGTAHRFLKQILSLPYLPADDIEMQFDRLCSINHIPEKIVKALGSIRKTWIESRIGTLQNWSIFGMPVSGLLQQLQYPTLYLNSALSSYEQIHILYSYC